MSKANTRNTRAPIPAFEAFDGGEGRLSITEQVVALHDAGEPEAAEAVVARADRQKRDAADELFAAKLLIQGATIPTPPRRSRWPEVSR